jgi:hypothetical protein
VKKEKKGVPGDLTLFSLAKGRLPRLDRKALVQTCRGSMYKESLPSVSPRHIMFVWITLILLCVANADKLS